MFVSRSRLPGRFLSHLHRFLHCRLSTSLQVKRRFVVIATGQLQMIHAHIAGKENHDELPMNACARPTEQ
jgi:hypothetical protein